MTLLYFVLFIFVCLFCFKKIVEYHLSIEKKGRLSALKDVRRGIQLGDRVCDIRSKVDSEIWYLENFKK